MIDVSATAGSHAATVGHVDDAGFVRAPAPLVYRRLSDLGRWPTWWAGCRVRSLPPTFDDPTGERFAVQLDRGWRQRLCLSVQPTGWRHDEGFELLLGGDVRGRAEFWLEPTHGGTLLHHLASFRTPLARPGGIVMAYRRAIRRGLWGCKDALQLEARTSAGLQP